MGHFTAFLVSTANMSLTHPWKFVVVPWVRRHLGLELPPFFGADNVEWAAKQKKANKHAPHELAFFRVSGRMHRTGFFDGWRGLLSVLGRVERAKHPPRHAGGELVPLREIVPRVLCFMREVRLRAGDGAPHFERGLPAPEARL